MRNMQPSGLSVRVAVRKDLCALCASVMKIRVLTRNLFLSPFSAPLFVHDIAIYICKNVRLSMTAAK
jgi:hypothetical protein